MIDFPNAKINLGLNVLGKRNDGFHEITTCYYPVAWKDGLEIIPSGTNKTTISLSGQVIPGNPEENLCVKAFKLFKKDFELPNVQIHLHKNIPSGGGLGGGSSDAAYTLMLSDRIFNLFLDRDIMAWYAAKLGSDCPFFIYNKPLLATGRGEVLADIGLDMSGKFIFIVNPGIHIVTSEAYRLITPAVPGIPLREVIENHSIGDWRKNLLNDFEEPVFNKYPRLREIKDHLYSMGAVYASMSGSGSCLYGIFDEQLRELPGEKPVSLRGYQTWMGVL